MSTSIRVSEATKQKLERLKRDDETWDEFLERLSRTEKDVEEMAGFLDDADIEAKVEAAHETLNESLEQRDSRSL